MKGIIFNLLEEFIIDQAGEDAYEAILADCPLTTPDPGLIVAPGTYPDEDFLSLAGCAAHLIGVGKGELLRRFGRFALPRLTRRYAKLFDQFASPGDLLRHTGMIHQVEVRKLYRDAETPLFRCREGEDGGLLLEYRSSRGLCHLVEGLLDGLAGHYGCGVEYRQLECCHRGGRCCTFAVRFGAGAGA
ncbi:MAG: heme NO-binding domain-containing protein [Thermodesulfobacteriota bacterium]